MNFCNIGEQQDSKLQSHILHRFEDPEILKQIISQTRISCNAVKVYQEFCHNVYDR